MKKMTLLALVALAITSCNKKEDAASRIENNTTVETTTQQVDNTVIKFDKETHDFGDIKKGEKGVYEFTITNEGQADLIIIDAKASCGCTVPEKPQQPIKPGESAKMKVEFSANTVGLQSKNVTVTANTAEQTHILTIKANVIE